MGHLSPLLPLRFRSAVLLLIGVLPQYFNTALFSCRSTAKNFFSTFLAGSMRDMESVIERTIRNYNYYEDKIGLWRLIYVRTGIFFLPSEDWDWFGGFRDDDQPEYSIANRSFSFFSQGTASLMSRKVRSAVLVFSFLRSVEFISLSSDEAWGVEKSLRPAP